MKAQKKQANGVIRIFTDGSGSRPDGKGSALAWLREDTEERKIEKIDDLTNNEAEYGAVLSALKALPNKIVVQILSDSELVCCQFSGKWKVSNPSLAELLSKIRDLIKGKELQVTLTWIPRRDNLAGKLL
jgi:ribonuclease HI